MNSAGFAMRILSKTSLKSTSSSKSSGCTDEVTKLRMEIDQLKQTVDHLNNVLDDKDAAIGNLAREKEKLYIELKKVQRVNRNVLQQLEDERDFYHKEKEYYCQEICNFKRSLRREGQSSNELKGALLLEQAADTMQVNLLEKDEIIYNVCVKYLRLKSSKASLKNKIDNLITQQEEAYHYIVSLLDASQTELDNIISKQIQNASINNKRYLNIVKRNARLHYENTRLKIGLVAVSNDPQVLEIQGSRKLGPAILKNTKMCKSDGKVQELNREDTVRLKRSLYAHSHEVNNLPSYGNPRMVGRKGVNSPVELEYPRKIVQKASSDPG